MVNCPKCNGEDIIKIGTRKTQRRGLVQKYLCKSCNHKFSNPEGWRMNNDPEYIDYALKLRSKGLSLRGVIKSLERKYKVKVAHTTIMNWEKDFEPSHEEREEFKFMIEGTDFNVSFKTKAIREDI